MNARKLATIAALPLLAIAATVRADITSDLQTPDDQTTFDNSVNLYSLAWRHAIDKYTTLYIDYAMTDNHADAHYDLGAGGHGVTTDCHDSTPMGFPRASPPSYPPLAGCRQQQQIGDAARTRHRSSARRTGRPQKLRRARRRSLESLRARSTALRTDASKEG